jgi:thymidylate synthase ThyX
MTQSIRERAARLADVPEDEFRIYTLGDGIGYVELTDFQGGDKEMVMRARKTHKSMHRSAPEADRKLNAQLVAGRPMHGSATRNTSLTFDVVMPLSILRQLTRHLVGVNVDGTDVWRTGSDTFEYAGAFNEMSLRYVRMNDARFYIPCEGRPKMSDEARMEIMSAISSAVDYYAELLKLLPPELARDYLPTSVYSMAEITMSWQGMANIYNERRHGSGAQWELSQYVEAAWCLCKRFVAPQACEHYEESLKQDGRR